MTGHTYDKEIAALLVIDPSNDFISRKARYGTAFGRSQKRTIAFLICSRS
jgi:hypothetical protein